MNDFLQPTLDQVDNHDVADALPVNVTGTQVANTGKTDELSVALANSKIPAPVEAPKPAPPGRYTLDYSLKGEAIHETHATIPHALARIAALARLGIVPSTGTVD